jgi:hypothetical protein
MKKIIDKLIDECVVGVDTYSHNGSTWLIFTESKQWVIELTESKTLWYNYNFFKNIFNYTSMDVVENQSYITQWVEDNIINKVKDTILEQNITEGEVEGIIEMAVKENSFSFVRMKVDCENVIENGVKEIQVNVTKNKMSNFVSDSLIQNGVKETSSNVMMFQSMKVEDTIQNGVKRTNKSLRIDGSCVIEDTIQNGVKETFDFMEQNISEWQVDEVIDNGVKDTQLHKGIRPSAVEHAIENGVKKTGPIQHKYMVEDIIENGVRHTLNTEYMPKTMVEDIIENGVKETKTPGKDGDIMSTIEWMEENKTNSVPKMIDDVIENGVKEIKTPNKDGDIKSTLEWMYKNNYQDDYNGSKMINNVIENGVKKTILRQHITDGNVETIIETGIKEVQPLPDQSGELIGYGDYYHGKEDRTKAFIDYLEETIKFGVKENIG